ncbi:MAG: hypothetical protein ACREBU_20680 [Nitrososphaera sp.]
MQHIEGLLSGARLRQKRFSGLLYNKDGLLGFHGLARLNQDYSIRVVALFDTMQEANAAHPHAEALAARHGLDNPKVLKLRTEFHAVGLCNQ